MTEPFTSADVAAGRVPPKVIENGVVVVPSAQVGAMTLPQHQAYIAAKGLRPLGREEAVLVAHPESEIDDWFGGDR